jgi:hypothetical protein
LGEGERAERDERAAGFFQVGAWHLQVT